jgi:hypothetical protein
MAALDFPSSPVTGDKYPVPPIAGIPQYTYDGEKWTTVGAQITTAAPATAIPLVESNPGVVGVSLKWAREDHIHPLGPEPSGLVHYDVAQGLTTGQQAQARTNIAASPVLRGYLSGLTLSTLGNSYTISVAAGVAADSTNADYLQRTTPINKTISVLWTVGDGGGALDTGSTTANTWYHIYLIKRVDTGVVDVIVSLSATGPTLPASYTLFRRIGSAKTNASMQWVLFSQNGDEFLWNVPIAEPTTASQGTAAILRTVTVPLGVKVRAIIAIGSEGATGENATGYVSSPDVSDQPSATFFNYGAYGVSGGTLSLVNIRTNLSAQIRTRNSASSPTLYVLLSTYGWIDTRGRDA